MAVPDARVELQIDGVWTSATVREGSKITHKRGRRNRGGRVDAAEVGLTLDSPDGLYNNRNPRSIYFGKLGRNTPARLTVDGVATFLHIPGAAGDRATTVDHASLDITGDIDIRADLRLGTYYATDPIDLAGKWSTTGNFSWLLTLWSNGRILLYWSTDGTATNSAYSTALIAVPPTGRIAIRATLDVDNGAAGRTATFYTSDSITGTWTQLGDPVIQAGTTSIFSSTSPLRVGSTSAFASLTGAVTAFQVRDGIGGTVVANPDWTAQPSGTTSFVDGAGRTWTLSGAAEITSRRVRCSPEVSVWPPKWHLSGHNITVPIQAAGLLRRLETGRGSLQSTLRRRIPSEASCVAYWPLEEGSEATQAYSPIPGVPVLVTTGFDYGADDSLLGSSALPRLVGGASISMDARVPTHTDTGQWLVTYVYWFSAAPATATEILEFHTTGTVRRITVTLGTSDISMRGYNSTGDEIMSVLLSPATNFFGTWNRLEVTAVTSGGNVEYHLGWIDVSGTGFGSQDTIAATAGIVTRINTRWGASGDGMRLGHLGVFTSANTSIYDGADDGFQGELAAARITRLTTEESVPVTVYQGTTTAMGAQRPNKLLTLLEECEDSDGGILYEDRNQLALIYRPRDTLYNQAPALTLTYGQVTQPFEPVADDTVRNIGIVTRAGGSVGRYELETGPLSIQEHPDGIGPYEDPVTLSLHHDGQPEQIAAWRTALSTWDEDRYPRVKIYLHKHPELIPEIVNLVEGDIIRITGLPDHLPAGPLDLMIDGFEETFGEFSWDITFVCSPAGPWTVGVLEDAVLGRLDTDGSALATGVDTDDTAWTVAVTDGPRWINSTDHAAMFPFDVLIGGERVTVTASAHSMRDAFGRSVSDGWGSADVGGAWTNAGGAAADYDVTGTVGTHTLTTVGVSRRSSLAAAHPDVDMVVDVASNDLASGASQYVGLMARAAGINDLYHCRVEFTTGAEVVLALQKRLAGVETQLATYTTTLTHVAGTFYRLRFQIQGTRLRARIWAVAATEPEVWHVGATDTDLTTAEQLGVRSILATGNTDVNPVMSYDNFAVQAPSLMTTTRSVNGIVKSHLAGAPLVLADPMRLAL